jgi:hypothetical protein
MFARAIDARAGALIGRRTSLGLIAIDEKGPTPRRAHARRYRGDGDHRHRRFWRCVRRARRRSRDGRSHGRGLAVDLALDATARRRRARVGGKERAERDAVSWRRSSAGGAARSCRSPGAIDGLGLERHHRRRCSVAWSSSPRKNSRAFRPTTDGIRPRRCQNREGGCGAPTPPSRSGVSSISEGITRCKWGKAGWQIRRQPTYYQRSSPQSRGFGRGDWGRAPACGADVSYCGGP